MSPNILRVGMTLYGYCGGYFGRDSYEDKTVEAVGADYVVARGCTSRCAYFYQGVPEDLLEFSKREEEERE